MVAARVRGRETGVRRAAAPRGRRALDPTGRAVPVGQRARRRGRVRLGAARARERATRGGDDARVARRRDGRRGRRRRRHRGRRVIGRIARRARASADDAREHRRGRRRDDSSSGFGMDGFERGRRARVGVARARDARVGARGYARREGERRRGFEPRTGRRTRDETLRDGVRARDESRDGFGEPPTENDVVVRERRVRGGGGRVRVDAPSKLSLRRDSPRVSPTLRARPRPSGPAAPHRAAVSDRVRVRTRDVTVSGRRRTARRRRRRAIGQPRGGPPATPRRRRASARRALTRAARHTRRRRRVASLRGCEKGRVDRGDGRTIARAASRRRVSPRRRARRRRGHASRESETTLGCRQDVRAQDSRDDSRGGERLSFLVFAQIARTRGGFVFAQVAEIARPGRRVRGRPRGPHVRAPGCERSPLGVSARVTRGVRHSSRASTPRRSRGFAGERRRGVCAGARRQGTPRGARTASRRHRRHRASRSAQSE